MLLGERVRSEQIDQGLKLRWIMGNAMMENHAHRRASLSIEQWTEILHEDPFSSMLGPIQGKATKDPDEPIRLGMKIEKRHCNAQGICHGGTLLAFLDTALGYVGAAASGLDLGGPTISITANFVCPAREGDWIESRVKVEKKSRSMMFVQGKVISGGETNAFASAVYKKNFSTKVTS